eukprot:2256584-Rhodomonas_salina.1
MDFQAKRKRTFKSVKAGALVHCRTTEFSPSITRVPRVPRVPGYPVTGIPGAGGTRVPWWP